MKTTVKIYGYHQDWRYVRASGMELNDTQEQGKCRKATDYPSRICAAKVSKVSIKMMCFVWSISCTVHRLYV